MELKRQHSCLIDSKEVAEAKNKQWAAMLEKIKHTPPVEYIHTAAVGHYINKHPASIKVY